MCCSVSSDGLCATCFFFFQAEDGIRDYKVTGVQTCALPISLCTFAGGMRRSVDAVAARLGAAARTGAPALSAEPRSEERRVGKECRWRWWPGRRREKGG